MFADSVDWARAHFAPNSVVVAMQATGSLYYYTDFIFVRWDNLHGSDMAAVEDAATRQGRPLVAIAFPFEVAEIQKCMPGHWTKIGEVQRVTFWRFDGR